MPVHNRPDIFLLFDKAVESVFSNSVIPKELVLVVDGPLALPFKEKVLEIATRYPIRVIWLPRNEGITNALNVGLSTIDSQWTMRADADDINLPNRFELQINALERGYELVGGAIEEVDSFGKFLAFKFSPGDEASIRKYARYRNPFNHMTVAFSTEMARKVGGYPNLAFKEDYALWALFLQQGAKVINLRDILVRATTGKSMFFRRGGRKGISAEIDLQRHLLACQLQSHVGAVGVAALRILILMLPAPFLTHFYMNFLRGGKKTN